MTVDNFFSFLIIVLALITGGALGGFSRYVLRHMEDNAQKQKAFSTMIREAGADIGIGAIAALIVPVFLTITQLGDQDGVIVSILSAEANETSMVVHGILILLGLSVLVGVIAPRFIMSMSEKLLTEQLNEIKSVQDEIDYLKEEIEDQHPGTNPDRPNLSIKPEDLRVLRAFTEAERFNIKRPTVSDLAQFSSLDADRIEKRLPSLMESGLIAKSSRSTGDVERMRLRSSGRYLITQN